MDKRELKFTTKEQSKREAEEAFLKLTPSQRVMEFLKLCHEVGRFQSSPTVEHDNNFVLKKKVESL